VLWLFLVPLKRGTVIKALFFAIIFWCLISSCDFKVVNFWRITVLQRLCIILVEAYGNGLFEIGD
jgi:hypothetical protein